ncbi:vWA domain-containing protein [Marinomonas algicola]|uniref:vWA domain-containing protein n=1 Tax=Marinomonas algicola TaxID=2773454 RepID=UPI001748C8C8|nr:VWA domain-containing protein [Marinomonas algicola]
MELLPGLYFARPTWLLLIVFTLICVFLFNQKGIKKTNFQGFIDPKLLPFLTSTNNNRAVPKWFSLLSVCLAIIGLSGISWEKQPQPTYASNAKTILLIDQSISLYATDIKPNRLTRLKHKLQDVINAIDEGEVAMVAFAGDAYTISPFSADKTTLTHFLLALDPLIMPLYGSNLLSGIETSLSLLNNTSSPTNLIIFTDSVSDQEVREIPQLDKIKSLNVSIIGIGTQEGGEIVLPDGNRLRKNNRLIEPKLPDDKLKQLANSLNGQYYNNHLTDKVINSITTNVKMNQKTLQESNALSNIWIEKGHWFMMPFLIWLLLQFRPGAYLLIIISFTVHPPPSMASPLDWFMTNDQRAQSRVDQGNWEGAAELFQNKKWQAASNYALEKYAEAADVLESQASSANDFYNLGNSLALSGEIEDAIKAYEQSLELNPDSKETKENLAYLKQKQKEQQDKEQQQNKADSEEDSEEDSDQQEQTSQNEDNNNQAQSDQKNNKQNNSSDEQEENQQEQAENQEPGEESDNKKNLDNHSKSENAPLSDEEKIALDQWLRQIQDDPGGLLKRKLWYQHQEKRAENRFKQEDGLPIW